MKIALLTPTFSPFSGIDRLVEEKAKALAKRHHVEIFALRSSMDIPGVKINVLEMPSSPFLERMYRLLMFLDRKKIAKYSSILAGYDQVISFFYPMNLLAAEAKRKNPHLEYVYHNAGVGIVESYSLLEKLYLQLFAYLTKKSIANADRIVSISRFLADEIEAQTGKKSSVEYVPVDKKRFRGARGDAIQKKFSIGKGPLLLYVGRISPHKGVHLLIDAFRIIQRSRPDAKLIIAGKHTFPSYSRKLRAMSNSSIFFPGFVPDRELPSYYAACDVYTTASLWEGFDIPIVEAYYCGKPSVAFDVGSHREVLKKGALVKKGDVEGFARAILSLRKLK